MIFASLHLPKIIQSHAKYLSVMVAGCYGWTKQIDRQVGRYLHIFLVKCDRIKKFYFQGFSLHALSDHFFQSYRYLRVWVQVNNIPRRTLFVSKRDPRNRPRNRTQLNFLFINSLLELSLPISIYVCIGVQVAALLVNYQVWQVLVIAYRHLII